MCRTSRTIRAGRCRTGPIRPCRRCRRDAGSEDAPPALGNDTFYDRGRADETSALPGVILLALRLLRRLVGAIAVLALVIVGAFFMLEAASGDAIDAYVAGIGGMDAARIVELRAAWGLDQGPMHRLGAYLAALAHGD